jgi:phage tail sheath protein FI
MAASYGAPGVYIEEQPSGSMPIQGVGTSVAAFVGFTQRYDRTTGDRTDPDGIKPQLVTSWPQYERIYGGFAKGAMLPYAVRGFFENGGSSCYIVRVPTGAADQPPELALTAANRPELPSFTVRALTDHGTRTEIEVVPPPPAEEGSPPSDQLTLRVFTDGEFREEISGISFGRNARTVEKTINEQSSYIRVEVPSVAGASLAERLPAPGRYALADPPPSQQAMEPRILEGSETERTGYQGLAIADSVTMVAIPDLGTVTTREDGTLDEARYLAFQAQLADWCTNGRTRMAILDTPPGLNATRALEWRERLAKDTPFATLYYPNVRVTNRAVTNGAGNGKAGGDFLTVPACGHIAGVWARTDAARGVWKAPANEELRGIAGLETTVTDGEQAELNPMGVNCIRSFGAMGVRVWGARTLSQTDQSWRYINVRRLFNFIEESIRQGTRWAVFEPNDRYLWGRVKRNINAFLRGVWMQGALVGDTPGQAFYVTCDATNNPKETVDEGKLIIEVGIAPVKPAEFVIFQISQWQGGGETSE